MAKLEMNKNTPLGVWFVFPFGDHLLNPLREKVSYEQRINEVTEASKLADEAGMMFLQLVKVIRSIFTTQAHTVCVEVQLPKRQSILKFQVLQRLCGVQQIL